MTNQEILIKGWLVGRVIANQQKRPKGQQNFSVQMSTSAKGSVRLFGTSCNSDIQLLEVFAEGVVDTFGVNLEASVGPINTQAEHLIL